MPTVKCPHCGKENDAAATLCSDCGYLISLDSVDVTFPEIEPSDKEKAKKNDGKRKGGLRIVWIIAVGLTAAAYAFFACFLFATHPSTNDRFLIALPTLAVVLLVALSRYIPKAKKAKKFFSITALVLAVITLAYFIYRFIAALNHIVY